MLNNPPYEMMICSAAGLIAGILIAGLAVRMRLKVLYERRLALLFAEKSLVEEKLSARAERADELGQRLCRYETELLETRSLAARLQVDKAKLETRCQRIPGLEDALALLNARYAALQDDIRQESAALATAREKGSQLETVAAEKASTQEQLSVQQEHNAKLTAQIAEFRTLLEDERKQAAEKISLLNGARDQLKSEFQHLAQRIFDDKSSTFAEQNRVQMDHLITPLRDQIGDFKKRVEDVYDKESRDRASLQVEILQLKDLNQQIGKEALNLTRALKGDSKARGNWGEVVLERVLEASGLQKGREYDTQVHLKDQKGKRYLPDVIVRLPQGKDVVVDAKVSLNQYELFYSAEDAERKEAALKAHIESVRSHIRSLAGKAYEDLEGVRSLDFVLMFIPVEAAFLAAVERDGNLYGEAFDKNIMVVSPSTLLVTLRTIENIWRHEHQNRHAVEIAKKAGALYDKFVGFVDALQDVGRQLDKARSAYRTASDRLANGRGNLIRRSQELKTLGVKAGKELPRDLLEMSDEGRAVDG